MKIEYALVTLNRLSELQRALRLVSPHVDRTIVVDGASEDGSIEWLNSQECKEMRVEVKVSKQYRYAYGNHTPRERNQYLELASKNDSWLLITDTDEYLQEEAVKSLRQLATDAERKGYNNIGFRAHDYWTYEDGQVYDNLSNYWHHSMFFKATPKMTYVGATHAGIHRPELQNRKIDLPFEYLHVKQERNMWRNSAYLWWTTAKNASNFTDDPIWEDFHRLMKKYGWIDWHEFNKAMVKGNLPQEIKDWFIANKDDDNPEKRAYFMTYFIWLHPNENVDQVSNRDKQWNYLEQCKRISNGL